jgi:hypothetical protein
MVPDKEAAPLRCKICYIDYSLDGAVCAHIERVWTYCRCGPMHIGCVQNLRKRTFDDDYLRHCPICKSEYQLSADPVDTPNLRNRSFIAILITVLIIAIVICFAIHALARFFRSSGDEDAYHETLVWECISVAAIVSVYLVSLGVRGRSSWEFRLVHRRTLVDEYPPVALEGNHK